MVCVLNWPVLYWFRLFVVILRLFNFCLLNLFIYVVLGYHIRWWHEPAYNSGTRNIPLPVSTVDCEIVSGFQSGSKERLFYGIATCEYQWIGVNVLSENLSSQTQFVVTVSFRRSKKFNFLAALNYAACKLNRESKKRHQTLAHNFTKY